MKNSVFHLFSFRLNTFVGKKGDYSEYISFQFAYLFEFEAV